MDQTDPERMILTLWIASFATLPEEETKKLISTEIFCPLWQFS
jgi:hypothetical protein